MIAREYGFNNGRQTMLGSNFTTDEMTRLETLRKNYHNHAEYLERVIDDRRLEFARWLRDNGKLGEGAAEF